MLTLGLLGIQCGVGCQAEGWSLRCVGQERAARTKVIASPVAPLGPSLSDVRDRALLLIGFAGALRCSELVALDVEDVTEDGDGLVVGSGAPRSTRKPKVKFEAFLMAAARRRVGCVRGAPGWKRLESPKESGGGSGVVRVRTGPQTMVCEVSDTGCWTARPLAGRLRSGRSTTCGHRLWFARHLGDLLEVRSAPAGATVRLHLTLPGRRPSGHATKHGPQGRAQSRGSNSGHVSYVARRLRAPPQAAL
jgi:hypothetical protein